MTSREEKTAAIAKDAAFCRADLVQRHAENAEDLFEIAHHLLAQAKTILVPLLGPEEAASRLHRVADAVRLSVD